MGDPTSLATMQTVSSILLTAIKEAHALYQEYNDRDGCRQRFVRCECLPTSPMLTASATGTIL